MKSLIRGHRFFVVGCGSIGKRHIGNLKSMNAGEIFIYDVDEHRRTATAKEYDVISVDTMDEGWAFSPNAVLIALPTNLHISCALEAAKRGCHIFIEKPLSHELGSELDELLDIAKAKKLVTLVGCNMRFHPAVSKIKELVNAGVVGKITGARVEFGQYLPDWHPWEDYRRGYSANKSLGGGIILDAIHEIDYIRWMLGEVTTVACFANKLSDLEIDTEDTSAIMLRFVSGAVAEVHLDYVQRTPSRTCKIIGDGGVIVGDCIRGSVEWYSDKTCKWQSFKVPNEWQLNQMYVDEMMHFLNCLNGDQHSIQDVIESEMVLKIALSAKKSAARQEFIRTEL